MKLELQNITKIFGSLVANDHISVTIESGEIHALLGENGAGKSTLMNVLYGLYDPEEGQILLDDEVVTFKGPGDAMAAGIGMVHQHFMLIPVFTVAENVALGHEPGSLFLDMPTARARVKEISDRFGFDVDPDAVVEDLPVGAQQRVEIIKALSRDAKVLVLDEPTAVLTPQETDELIEIMRQLKAAGTSIIFITHKLREVRAVADSITVIRRGKIVGEASPTSSETDLASMMVGRAVDLGVEKAPANLRGDSLLIDHLTVLNDTGQRVVDDVSLTVQRGEILAVAGVQGNGQTELIEALMGLQGKVFGDISLDGNVLTGKSIKDILAAGVGFVPEDRTIDGLVASFTLEENFILDMIGMPEFSHLGVLKQKAIRDNANYRIDEFDVRTQSSLAPAGTLSGGNQQKVVVARELSRPLKLFIACQPTRGLDVGSIEFIHKRIVSERDHGTPVLVVSTELDEVVALADRIAVMYRGKMIGIVPGNTSRDVLGLMMAGIPLEQATEHASTHQTAVGSTTQAEPQGGDLA